MYNMQFAHWHQFFEDLPISPLDLYKTLETGLATTRVPETTASQVEFLEGGPLSSKRVYLQIRRDWLTYHVCFAPFGTGFFVSTRLFTSPWNSWPIMAGLAGCMFLMFFFIFVGVTSAYNNAALGFLVTAFFFFPTVLLFALILFVWAILCLRLTYYRLDTMMAFQEAVHRLVVATVNTVVQINGRKPLSEEQSKPILHRLLRR